MPDSIARKLPEITAVRPLLAASRASAWSGRPIRAAQRAGEQSRLQHIPMAAGAASGDSRLPLFFAILAPQLSTCSARPPTTSLRWWPRDRASHANRRGENPGPGKRDPGPRAGARLRRPRVLTVGMIHSPVGDQGDPHVSTWSRAPGNILPSRHRGNAAGPPRRQRSARPSAAEAVESVRSGPW